jgi:hypothetical protein
MTREPPYYPWPEKAAELGVQFSVDNDGPSPVIYSIRNKK